MPAQELTFLREHNWVKSRPLAFLMEQCLPSLESLHFAGGEPLIIPEMLEALDLCIQAGRADQIDLSYNTNITVIPDRVARLWPYFRSVTVHCSVDGFGAVNDYIRRPSQWSDIDRNLHLLDQHFKEWKLRLVVCSATVQAYNVLQLGELFDYLAGSSSRLCRRQCSFRYMSRRICRSEFCRRMSKRWRARGCWPNARKPLPVNSDYEMFLSTIDTTLAYLDESLPLKHFMDFLYFWWKIRIASSAIRGGAPVWNWLASYATGNSGARRASIRRSTRSPQSFRAANAVRLRICSAV